MDSRGNGSFRQPKNNKKEARPRQDDYEAPEQEFIVVEDRAATNWMVIRLSDDSNDIICRCKIMYWATDIAEAMNKEFSARDILNG